jgi:hypothetical protein
MKLECAGCGYTKDETELDDDGLCFDCRERDEDTEKEDDEDLL